MAVGRFLYLSLVFNLDPRRCCVQAQLAMIVPELLWWGRQYSGNFDNLATLPQYQNVMIGGGPVSIGFKATWDTVVNNGHILGFDDGQGNNKIEVFNSLTEIFYGASTTGQPQVDSTPTGFFTLSPNFEHTFLFTIAADGTLSMFYEGTQILRTAANPGFVPTGVSRSRMMIGADADGSGMFDGFITFVAIFNQVVTWDQLLLAIATTTTTTTTSTYVAFSLHMQTSNEVDADTQSGASISFQLDSGFTSWQTFTERAYYDQVVSEYYNLVSWPIALLVTTRASAPNPDSWGLRQISVTMARGGADFVVLPPGNNLSYSPSSEYWIDPLVHQSSVGAQRYPFPELRCRALVGINNAPDVTCLEGGFIPHNGVCTTRCLPGYNQTITETTCMFGTFTIDSYSCIPMSCGQPNPPANGLLGTCVAPLSSGESCVPECQQGFTVQGVTHCLLGEITDALCVGLSCNITNLPAHASQGTCPMDLASGMICQLTCDYGYSGGAVSCFQGVSSITPCLVTFTIEVETSTQPFSETSVGANIDFMLAEGWSDEQVMTENAVRGEMVRKNFVGLADWPTALRIKGRGMDYWGFLDRHIWIIFEGHRQSLRVCEQTAIYPYLRVGSGAEPDSYAAAMFKLPCLYCVPPIGIINAAEVACAEGASVGHGANCTAQCAIGYFPSVSVLSCALDVLIPPTFTCSELPCVAIQPPLHGAMGSCQSQIASRTSCAFSCNAGYTLSAVSACYLGSLSQASCEPSSCVVTAPAHGQLRNCPPTLAHGDSCLQSCDQGYFVNENVSCAFGVLTSVCTPKPCVNSTPPTHGSVGDCLETLQSGSSCQPQCFAGYQISGRTSCSLGELSTATCLPNPCLIPTSIANGSVGECGTVEPTTQNRFLSSGAECDLVCNPGYRLNSGKTTCFLGQLSLVGCIPDDCLVILPTNADFGDCPRTLRSGESCQPTCRMGYQPVGAFSLRGNVLLSCFAGALSQMECSPDACDSSNAPAHGSQGNCLATLLSNTTCQPACEDGYLVSGPSLCLVGQFFAATCLPMPCDLQVPENGTRGDCPDVLQSGSICQPSCNLGYAASGNTTCNAGNLQTAACIARSCEIFELPLNSISYGDCRRTLASGRSCTPICAPGFRLHLEFSCDRGTLQLAECKESPGIDIQERLISEEAYPYILIGCAIALLLLLIAVFGTLCWCHREWVLKPHVDIENLRESDRIINRVRHDIDEMQIQLRRPPLPGPEDVGDETAPGATRALTVVHDEEHSFGGIVRQEAIIEPTLRNQYEEEAVRGGAIRTITSPRHEYEEETLDYGGVRTMTTPRGRGAMRTITSPRHAYEEDTVDYGGMRTMTTPRVVEEGGVRRGAIRTMTTPRYGNEEEFVVRPLRNHEGNVRHDHIRMVTSPSHRNDEGTVRHGANRTITTPRGRGGIRAMSSPSHQQFSSARLNDVLNTDDIRVDIS